ncbi:MAG: hypothetical protein J1E83_12830 [Lachnospiraceae bacterium]|nr:hypothetical protein [Lachnospiraceae bacterium]
MIKLDVNTKVINMDVLIPEQIVKNKDDSYTIFLNARLSREKQLEAYLHALQHIEDGDFEKEDVDYVELSAHNML